LGIYEKWVGSLGQSQGLLLLAHPTSLSVALIVHRATNCQKEKQKPSRKGPRGSSQLSMTFKQALEAKPPLPGALQRYFLPVALRKKGGSSSWLRKMRFSHHHHWELVTRTSAI
jgi:hypothetical protein